MKLFCLSSNPSKPCLIVTFKGVTIMLDCGLDQTALMHFVPHSKVDQKQLDPWKPSGKNDDIQSALSSGLFKQNQGQIFIDTVPEFIVPELRLIDMKNVDVILISNAHNMLALPFITEYTQFQGRIYLTEPALQVGKMMMEELVQHINCIPDNSRCTGMLKLPGVQQCLTPGLLQSLTGGKSWKRLYSSQDVNSCFSKMNLVGYNEKINVLGALTVSPSSAGQSLGSCNWAIQSAFDKVVYLSNTSMLTTHPKSFDQSPLMNPDVLIISNLTPVPAHNPDPMIREFCANVALTLRSGGNVLVPCYPSGVTYDLFECLSSHLESAGIAVPIFFISPHADSSLAFSNIFSEWLSNVKQNRVYLPEFPFPHADLLKSGRLMSFKSINEGLSQEYRTPCVVFTGHPSLRFGDVTHFLNLWGKSNNNLIIFTEPEFNYLEALQPFQPLNITVQNCPIDTSLNYVQVNKLIKDLSPNCVCVPEVYTKPDHRWEQSLETNVQTITYKLCSVSKLPVKPSLEQVEMTRSLADSLVTSEVSRGVFWSPVNATVSVKDGRHVLDKPGQQRKTRFVWGRTDIDGFKRCLHKRHCEQVNVDEDGSGFLVHLPDDDSLIRIEGNDTHIIANSESTRVKIRDALLDCLSTL